MHVKRMFEHFLHGVIQTPSRSAAGACDEHGKGAMDEAWVVDDSLPMASDNAQTVPMECDGIPAPVGAMLVKEQQMMAEPPSKDEPMVEKPQVTRGLKICSLHLWLVCVLFFSCQVQAT